MNHTVTSDHLQPGSADMCQKARIGAILLLIDWAFNEFVTKPKVVLACSAVAGVVVTDLR